ncbi:hypothetical protein FALBO_1348 [Fusarium albosuccineum]|uniref:Uncharacterized protein n=1 Tax=Fusarium albosuccineum TaxID=1237068 RepID=A0A8H4LLU6_9HYPO|nr:hypothetical protein FALBO_1348 [Fusarium albosuccineum]
MNVSRAVFHRAAAQVSVAAALKAEVDAWCAGDKTKQIELSQVASVPELSVVASVILQRSGTLRKARPSHRATSQTNECRLRKARPIFHSPAVRMRHGTSPGQNVSEPAFTHLYKIKSETRHASLIVGECASIIGKLSSWYLILV